MAQDAWGQYGRGKTLDEELRLEGKGSEDPAYKEHQQKNWG